MKKKEQTSSGNAGNSGNAGLRTRNSSSRNSSSRNSSSKNASTEPRVPSPPRGWHSRGYLPHLDSNVVVQHVTFHLADSLPKETLQRISAEIQELKPEQQDIEKRRRIEALVDAGHGACWLQQPEYAQIVQDALLHFDGERYRMIAWVVMPNHVHALFQTINDWSMNAVVGSWKTFTANAIGRRVRKANEPVPHVWHPEFWDRYIRDQNHFDTAIAYIHNNPVQAGLVTHPEQWPWSSAYPENAGNESPGNAGHESPGNAGHESPGNAGLRTRTSGNAGNAGNAGLRTGNSGNAGNAGLRTGNSGNAGNAGNAGLSTRTSNAELRTRQSSSRQSSSKDASAEPRVPGEGKK